MSGWLARDQFESLNRVTVERTVYRPHPDHPRTVRLYLHNTQAIPVQGWLVYKLQKIIESDTVIMFTRSERFVDLDGNDSMLIYEGCEDEVEVRGTYTLELFDLTDPEAPLEPSVTELENLTDELPPSCDTTWHPESEFAA